MRIPPGQKNGAGFGGRYSWGLPTVRRDRVFRARDALRLVFCEDKRRKTMRLRQDAERYAAENAVCGTVRS